MTHYPPPTVRIGNTQLAEVLIPHVVLPSQITTAAATWSGERRLALAVLEDAITTLFRNLRIVSVNAQREILIVDLWLESPDDTWPFSFLNVCAVCRIDPEYLREGIREARLRKVLISRGALKRNDTGRTVGAKSSNRRVVPLR